MEHEVTLRSLIERGDEILKGITYVDTTIRNDPSILDMGSGYSAYKSADERDLWVNTVIRFLSYEYEGDRIVGDFEKEVYRFERGNKHRFDFSRLLSLLKSCESFPIKKKGISDENNMKKKEVSLYDELENIRQLESSYVGLRDRGYDFRNNKDTIDSYSKWYSKAVVIFSRYNEESNSDYLKFKSVDNGKNGYCLSDNFDEINGAYSILMDRLENDKAVSNIAKQDFIANNKKVFIVHGHDNEMKLEVEAFLKQIDLEPIILAKQANMGNTIIEKFEKNADVGYAIVLLSPCDEGRKKGTEELKGRARQNVILELGYFIGRLGRNRVCALKKSEVEEPSDIIGVVYTPYDDRGAWQFAVAKELRAAGYDIDMNKL